MSSTSSSRTAVKGISPHTPGVPFNCSAAIRMASDSDWAATHHSFSSTPGGLGTDSPVCSCTGVFNTNGKLGTRQHPTVCIRYAGMRCPHQSCRDTHLRARQRSTVMHSRAQSHTIHPCSLAIGATCSPTTDTRSKRRGGGSGKNEICVRIGDLGAGKNAQALPRLVCLRSSTQLSCIHKPGSNSN